MYLRHLYPAPKFFTEDESKQYVFDSRAEGSVSGLTADQAERVRSLWYRFSCNASELTLRQGTEAFTFTVGTASAKLHDGDAYALSVTERGISVVGRDAQSLMKGIMTLMQLICPAELTEGKESFHISAAEVRDAPAIGFRAVHFCIFPESKLYTLKKAIHLAGFLKMTHVVLEFWGIYPYEAMPELHWKKVSFTKAEIKELVDLIRSYGMEVIPMINHFGHASSARACMGRHTVLNANLRLAKLFEPDGWTWCLSNPDTYKLLSEMREELYEVCGEGSYFHLGFDEAYSFATCEKCRQRVPYELLAEYINRLTEDLCAHGRRPIIWHDEFIDGREFSGKIKSPVVALGQNHNTYPALELLDRRAIIADWQYDYRNSENVTSKFFMDKGFDVLLCPWDNTENIRSLAENTKKLGAMGVMLTTWHHLPQYLPMFPAVAEMLWRSADKDEHAAGFNWTESAALLRTLYDTDGDFASSGWNAFEVEQ